MVKSVLLELARLFPPILDSVILPLAAAAAVAEAVSLDNIFRDANWVRLRRSCSERRECPRAGGK